MRLNLNNVISFEAENEVAVSLPKEELNKIRDTERFYFCVARNKVIKKSHLILDFGQFKKSVYFDTAEDMENFIFKVFPQNYEGVSCINDYE